jgi:hypothetical protein
LTESLAKVITVKAPCFREEKEKKRVTTGVRREGRMLPVHQGRVLLPLVVVLA